MTKSKHNAFMSPLDRFIQLIAEIEVERYLAEVRDIRQQQAEREHACSDLRQIQQ